MADKLLVLRIGKEGQEHGTQLIILTWLNWHQLWRGQLDWRWLASHVMSHIGRGHGGSTVGRAMTLLQILYKK